MKYEIVNAKQNNTKKLIQKKRNKTMIVITAAIVRNFVITLWGHIQLSLGPKRAMVTLEKIRLV